MNEILTDLFNTYLNTFLKLLFLVILLCLMFLVKAAYDYLRTKISDSQAAKLDKFIDELTAAADQTLKEEDPDGTKRYEYVLENLITAGYEITDAIIAKIEASVFKLPHENKGADVK